MLILVLMVKRGVKCPKCRHRYESESLNGRTRCPRCGKFFIFDEERFRDFKYFNYGISADTKYARMLIPNPPRCICGARDWLVYQESDAMIAKCKKCDFKRVYYGSRGWTGRFDR